MSGRRSGSNTGSRQGSFARPDSKNGGESIHIWAYRNGEPDYSGKPLHVSSEYLYNFDSFLTYLTRQMRVTVKTVYDIDGHKIKGCKELETGEEYVVGTGSFKEEKYGRGRERTRRNMKKDVESDYDDYDDYTDYEDV